MFVVLALSAVVCAANWWSCHVGDRRLEMITKPIATVGAIALALVAGGPSGATIAAVVALALCLAGDVALLPQVDRFIVGLASFLLGHVAFIVMFALLGFDRWSMAGIGIVFVALLLGSAAIPILRHSAAKGFGGPVRAYLAVISTMCVLGWATGLWLVALGVTSFVISDTILGFRRFVMQRPWQQVAIMVTYHLALFALAGSLALA